MRRYARVFLGALAAGLFCIACLNYIVDPLGAYDPHGRSALNDYKLDLMDRISKAEVARSTSAATILLGDSMVWSSMDPRHAGLRELGSAYNFAISCGSLYEAERMIELVLEHHTPKLIVWCIPPEIAQRDRVHRLNADGHLSRLNPNLSEVAYHGHNLFGQDATRKSLQVIAKWSLQRPSDVYCGYTPINHRIKDTSLYFRSTIMLPQTAEYFLSSPVTEEHAQRIKRIWKRSKEQGSRLIVVTPPVHAEFVDTLYSNGYGRLFDNGIRFLTRLADEINKSESQGFPIEVWDFTAFSGPNAEEPPEPGSTRQMKWYLDSVHYRPNLGHAILDRILGRSISDELPADFGMQVTVENVENHLIRIHHDRSEYLAGRNAGNFASTD